MSMTQKKRKDKGSSKFQKLAEKLFYWIVFFSALVALVVEAGLSFSKYLDNPTFTELKLWKQQETTLPVVTICPQYGEGYKPEVFEVWN